MRHFLIRAFEAIILVCSLIGALGVTLFAAAMVMENITLATLNGSLPGVFTGAPAATEPDALAVWLSAGAGAAFGLYGDHSAERRGPDPDRASTAA